MNDLSTLKLIHLPATTAAGPDVLIARWLGVPLATVIQAHYNHLLAEGLRLQTANWLLDLRFRPVPDAMLLDWVGDDWLPRVLQAFTPIRPRIAYLISMERAAYLRADARLQRRVELAQLPGLTYDMATFTNEAEALSWLNDCRPL